MSVTLDQAKQALEVIQRYFSELEDSLSESEPDTEAEPESTTVDPETFFKEAANEYAKDLFETKPWGSQWLLVDKSYAEDYSLAVIENDILYLTHSLEGEGARPFDPLYKDMDKDTPQKRIKKLCACISIHSPKAGAKLRAYIDMSYKHKKV